MKWNETKQKCLGKALLRDPLGGVYQQTVNYEREKNVRVSYC